MALTKISGDILDSGIDVAGIVTATSFDGPFIAGAGNSGILAGIITATELDLNGSANISNDLVVEGNLTANGDFTTLNTTLREVELLRVDAQNDNVAAGIITQTGAGNILELYDTSTNVLTVKDGGRVGIGTTNPNAQLDVYKTGTGTVVDTIITRTSGGGAFAVQCSDVAAANPVWALRTYSAEDLVLSPGGHANANEKVRIKANTGYVGIGSAIPTAMLDVNGDAKFTGIITANQGIRVNADSTGYNDNLISVGESDDLSMYHYNGVSYLEQTNTGGFTIKSNTFRVKGINNSLTSLETLANGAVDLYYNNQLRLETDANGVQIKPNVGGVTQLGIAQTTTTANSINGTISFINSDNTTAQIQGRTGAASTTGDIIFLCNTVGDESLAILEDGKVRVPDRGMFVAGTNNGLTINNDGTNSLITDSSSAMFVRSNRVLFQNSAGNRGYGEFTDGGSVYFTYDNVKRIETSGIGVTVTGEVATSQDYPNFRPTLDLNFAAEKKLDPRITYSRTGPASFVNEFGKVVLVGGNAPRFDYDPVTRESKGLLIEESRTNALLGTGNMGSSGKWAVGGDRGSQGENVEGPDGTLTAIQNVYNGTSGDLNIYYTPNQLTTTNSTVHTFSVFAKAAPGNSYINGIRLRSHTPNRSVSFNVINGTVGATNEGSSSISEKRIIKYPNGWYRCIMTYTSGTDGDQGIQIYVENEGGNAAALNNPSANGEAMYFWGAQHEEGSFVTSFIPTNGLTATRGADIVRIMDDDFTDIFGTEFKEFSLVADYDNDFGVGASGQNYAIFDMWGESTGYNDRIQIFRDDVSPYHIETRAFGQGNALFNNGNITASTLAKTQRFAASWYVPDYSNTSSRRFVVSMGGEAVDVIADNTGTTVPQLTRMGIGCNPTRLDFTPGLLHFKRLMVYNKTLSDGQLQNLSAQ